MNLRLKLTRTHLAAAAGALLAAGCGLFLHEFRLGSSFVHSSYDLLHIFRSFNAPVLQLGDGTVVHIPGDPVSSFPAWCAAMERPELSNDERFVTREARHAHRDRRDSFGT